MGLFDIFKSAVGFIPGIGPAIRTGLDFIGGDGDKGDIFSKIAGAAGAGIGGMTGAAANNRGAQVNAAFDTERLNQGREGLRQSDDQIAINSGQLSRQQINDFHNQMLLREQEGRVGRRSAMRDLQTAEYIGGGGASQKAPVTTSGRTLNTMGLGGRASTEGEIRGAAGMRNEVMSRLEGGNPLPMPERQAPVTLPGAGQPRRYEGSFAVDPKLMKPGIMERIGDIAGPVLTGFGNWSGSNTPSTQVSKQQTPTQIASAFLNPKLFGGDDYEYEG